MRYGFLLILIGTMMSCGKGQQKSAEEFFAQADSLLKKGEFQSAVLVLEEANVTYPNDTVMVIRNLNACSDIWAQHLGNLDKAIDYQQKIIALNEKSDAAANALFKIGFTYETLLFNLEKAKTIYEEFLAKYPNHTLAKDVKVSLEHLGESDDELLERLLKNADKTKAK